MQRAGLGILAEKIGVVARHHLSGAQQQHRQHQAHAVGAQQQRPLLAAFGDLGDEVVERGGQEQDEQVAQPGQQQRDVGMRGLEQEHPGALPREGGDAKQEERGRDARHPLGHQHIEAVTEEGRRDEGRQGSVHAQYTKTRQARQPRQARRMAACPVRCRRSRCSLLPAGRLTASRRKERVRAGARKPAFDRDAPWYAFGERRVHHSVAF
ncbi:hypothetical protein D3C72_1327780 [compost metagenome]